MENPKQSHNKIAVQSGVLLGLVLMTITVIMYVSDLELFTKWWIGIITLLVIIGFGVVVVAKTRKSLGDYINFKQGFTAYFIMMVIGTLISTLFGILLFNYIDPEAAALIKEKTLEMTLAFMERFNTPKEAIDEAMLDLEKQDSFGVVAQLKSYVLRLLFMSVFGALVALIMRRKDPNTI